MLPFSYGRYPQVIFEEIIPQIIPIGGNFILNYAEICDMKTLKNAEKSRSLGMIKVTIRLLRQYPQMGLRSQ